MGQKTECSVLLLLVCMYEHLKYPSISSTYLVSSTERLRGREIRVHNPMVGVGGVTTYKSSNRV
jgi:hypothetical protein